MKANISYDYLADEQYFLRTYQFSALNIRVDEVLIITNEFHFQLMQRKLLLLVITGQYKIDFNLAIVLTNSEECIWIFTLVNFCN